MAWLAKVIASKVAAAVRYIKVRTWGTDLRSVPQAVAYGIDSVPRKERVAVYLPTGEKGKSVIVGYLNKNQLAEEGEFRTFSEDNDGNVAFYIYQKADGTCEINGSDDFLVSYNNLRDQFNDLKVTVNSLVNKHNAFLTEYKAHVHTGVTSGTSSTGTTISTQTNADSNSADISTAKLPKIKTQEP